MSESSSNDIESKFIDEVCDFVIESLEISYNERRIVKPLLKKSISTKLNNRWGRDGIGLLQQYESYILDTVSERMIDDLDLPKETKVNHDNITRSKFNDIIKAIKIKYSIKDQRKEKISQISNSKLSASTGVSCSP